MMLKSVCIVSDEKHKKYFSYIKERVSKEFDIITEIALGNERFLDDTELLKIISCDVIIVLSDTRLEMIKTLGIPCMYFSENTKGFFYKKKEGIVVVNEIKKDIKSIADDFFKKIKELLPYYKGIFITFEGLECSGKSTQATLLVDELIKNKRNAIYTKEPGSTETGKEIKSIFFKRFQELNGITEALLMFADRNHHLFSKGGIIEELKKGSVVVCDRYNDSTVAYQGFGSKKISLNVIFSIARIVTDNIKPDITFFIDITKETAKKRMKIRKYNEDIDEAFLSEFDTIREGYLFLAKLFPYRIKVIDGEKSVGEIHKDIMSHVDILLRNLQS